MNIYDTAKVVLIGKLEWKYPIEEVNTYIDALEEAARTIIRICYSTPATQFQISEVSK